MSRKELLRGVSAGAFTLVCVAYWAETPAVAQQTLPTIDVGGARRVATQPRRDASSRASVQRAPTTAPQPAASTQPSGLVSRWSPTLPDGRPAFVEKFQLPNTVASVTRRQIQQRVNIVNTEDAVKYLPSLFVRKRNIGDTQAVLQTRTWGVNSSARSLVYADDLLLTALIGNDNTIGAPRWGLVAPEEIERIDFLYGPFSAQYPGNSMGGVLQITTRMPEKLEVSAKNTTAIQDFSLWGTSRAFVTNVSSFFVGDKMNDLSWTVSGNWQRGSQQPLTYVTAPTNNLYGYPGAYFATTRYGAPATVLGATGNLSNDQVNAKLKFAYDFTPTVRATYTLGFWSNDGTSTPQNYTVAGYGPWFGRATGTATTASPAFNNAILQNFASGYYRIQEKMLTNAAAVKSNTGGLFDFEISASNFTYLQSDQRAPFSGAVPFGGYTATGRDTRFTGTYWTLFDAKGIVRPEGMLKGHDISFGVHGDQFHLNNPTYLTGDWTAGQAAAFPGAISFGNGTTRTQALWFQDAWKINPQYKFTVGIRGEHWQASDGYNQSTGINSTGTGYTGAAATRFPIFQPNLYSTRFSPKGSLQWTPDDYWTVTGSVGMANRFPTTRELYNLQTITSTGVVANPNPNLRPETALTKELAIERKIGRDGTARISFFDEEVRDAIIAQNTFIPGSTQLASTPVNVERIRNSGVEVALQKDNVFFKGLELTGSATWLNARIISNPTWAPAGGANFDQWCWSVAGKTVPSVPDWRGTVTATYRPDDHWAFTVAARYQGRMWTTQANNDIAHGVYQSFDRFFVVDTKIHYKWNDRFSFDFGVDNIGNYKYMLFHPFPQRTFYVAGKYEFGPDKKGSPGIFFTGNEGGWPELAGWFQPAAFAID